VPQPIEQDTPGAAPIRLRLLGRFALARDGNLVRLPTRKMETLLAYLALHPRAHSRDALATLCWGDTTDDKARASLRNALAAVRRALGPDALRVEADFVQISPDFFDHVWLDVRELRAQCDELRTNPSADPTALDLALYQGDLLADAHDDWIEPERQAVRASFVEAAIAAVHAWRGQAMYAQAIRAAEKIIQVDVTCEAAYQHLMFCHAMLGERDAALAQFARCRSALVAELGVAPSAETLTLAERIRRGEVTATQTTSAAALSNLPSPLTRFIGREHELSALTRRMAAHADSPGDADVHRLVTLTGAGGCGKTRMALQAASQMLGDFADGAWWVPLASVTDGTAVIERIAQALGVRPALGQPILDALIAHARPRRMLLVLDNCEHLLAACANAADALLSACPRLHILATSREALAMAGERVWLVPPLRATATDAGDGAMSEAAALFVDRALAVQPELKLAPRDLAVVEQICRRLDGIPLAIELAAARMRALTVEQIAARLDDRFNLLTGGNRAALPRHQTLRAALAWSWDLLDDEGRIVWGRLSVFVGGCTLDAAEQVARAAGQNPARMLDMLTGLVDKSVLLAEAQRGEVRYRMLETIRHFGLGMLRASGQLDDALRVHLDVCLRLAERAEDALAGEHQTDWLKRIDDDYDNMRAALQWASNCIGTAEIKAGLRLGGALWRYWGFRGAIAEGSERLAALLARAGPDVAPLARARALTAAGFLATRRTDYAAAEPLLREAAALWRSLDAARPLAFVLHYLGWSATAMRDLRRARDWYEESLLIRRTLGEPGRNDLADTLIYLGLLEQIEGRLEPARDLLEEGLAIKRALGDTRGIAFAHWNLGNVAFAQADLAQAQRQYEAALAGERALESKWGTPFVLEGFGNLAAVGGHPARAAVLYGAADHLRHSTGAPLPPLWQAEHARVVEGLRTALGQANFDAHWSRGRALSLSAIMDFALDA
jgi:non-specific serine/threonine protein kinase